MLESISQLWDGAKLIDMYFQDLAIKYQDHYLPLFRYVGEFVRANASGCVHLAWSWQPCKSKLARNESLILIAIAGHSLIMSRSIISNQLAAPASSNCKLLQHLNRM